MNSQILKYMTIVSKAILMLASCNKIEENHPGNGFRASIELTGGNCKPHFVLE